MNRNKAKNMSGVTLVEVLLSLVVLLIVMMGLMQTALLSIESNTTNQFRDAAVNIAAQEMSNAKSMDFGDLKDDRDPVNPAPRALGLKLTSCKNEITNPAQNKDYICDPVNGPFFEIDQPIRNMTAKFGVVRCVSDLDVNSKMVTILVKWNYKQECAAHFLTTVRRNFL